MLSLRSYLAFQFISVAFGQIKADNQVCENDTLQRLDAVD